MSAGFSVQLSALTNAAPALLDATEAAGSAATPMGPLGSGYLDLDAAFDAFASGWGRASSDLAEACQAVSRAAVAAAVNYHETDTSVAAAASPALGPNWSVLAVPWTSGAG